MTDRARRLRHRLRQAWRAFHAPDIDAVRMLAERDGYRAAFEAVNAEVAALRAEAALVGQGLDRAPDPAVAALPGVLVITLPKSGTVYTQAKLTRSFGLRPRQVCHGGFPRAALDPVALGVLARGGRLAMSHADARAANIAAIRASTLRPVLHLRDPRPAMLSMLHHIRSYHADPNLRHFLARIGVAFPAGFHASPMAMQLDAMIATYLPASVTWIADWLAALDGDPPLAARVLTTRYEALATQEGDYLRGICAHVGLPAAQDFAAVARDGGAHFRQGDDKEWRRVLTPAQVAAATACLPDTLRQRMGWH